MRLANCTRCSAKILTASLTEQPAVQEDPELDIDVPEETESVLEELFSSLQDKVRAPLLAVSSSHMLLGHCCAIFCCERHSTYSRKTSLRLSGTNLRQRAAALYHSLNRSGADV